MPALKPPTVYFSPSLKLTIYRASRLRRGSLYIKGLLNGEVPAAAFCSAVWVLNMGADTVTHEAEAY